MSDIYLEITPKKTFACSVQWPGWCRAGKTEQAATQALIEYIPRYEKIARRAEVEFEPGDLNVIQRVEGDATTNFGAPSIIVANDKQPIDEVVAIQGIKLLQAAWSLMTEVADNAPRELRKGPRGGGRDTDEIVRHVIEAERSYARMIGIRHAPFAPEDKAALNSLRAEIASVLGKASDGSPLREKGWPTTYALRRISWHVIDHTWEIEDRSH